MRKSIKLLVISAAISTMMGLTACQNNPAPAGAPEQRLTKHDHHDAKGKHHHEHEGKKLSKEELEQRKAEFEKKLATHKAEREALNKACQNKVGENITLKIADKTFEGSCEVQFKPKPQSGQHPKKQGMPPVPPSIDNAPPAPKTAE